MGKYTNEKSLVVVQDNFLNKVKNFFAKFFWSKKSKFDYMQDEQYDNNENDFEQFEQQEPVEKVRKLYDFDADNNDDWTGGINMINQDENELDLNEINEQNDEKNSNEEKNINEDEYDGEVYSEAYREKQELEQKLMNYYESIKKRNLIFNWKL